MVPVAPTSPRGAVAASLTREEWEEYLLRLGVMPVKNTFISFDAPAPGQYDACRGLSCPPSWAPGDGPAGGSAPPRGPGLAPAPAACERRPSCCRGARRLEEGVGEASRLTSRSTSGGPSRAGSSPRPRAPATPSDAAGSRSHTPARGWQLRGASSPARSPAAPSPPAAAAPPAGAEQRGAAGAPAGGPPDAAAGGAESIEDRQSAAPAAAASGTEPQLTCSYRVGIEEDEVFRVVWRLVGAGGENMKYIVEHSDGARVRVSGRGCRYPQSREQVASAEPLVIRVTAPRQSTLDQAAGMVEELLRDVHREYVAFCRTQGLPAPRLRVAREEQAPRGGPSAPRTPAGGPPAAAGAAGEGAAAAAERAAPAAPVEAAASPPAAAAAGPAEAPAEEVKETWAARARRAEASGSWAMVPARRDKPKKVPVAVAAAPPQPQPPVPAPAQTAVASRAGQRLICRFPVQIEDEPQFRVVRRLIGPSGENMKRIVDGSKNAKVWICGQGVVTRDPSELLEPLTVKVCATNADSLESASAQVEALLATVHEEYRRFCAERGLPAPDLAARRQAAADKAEAEAEPRAGPEARSPGPPEPGAAQRPAAALAAPARPLGARALSGPAGASPSSRRAEPIWRWRVGIEDEDKFRVVRRIIGQGGRNMRSIVDQSGGAKVWLCGKGVQGHDPSELSEPLTVKLSVGQRGSGVEKASALIEELLATVHEEYRAFCREGGLPPPTLRLLREAPGT